MIVERFLIKKEDGLHEALFRKIDFTVGITS